MKRKAPRPPPFIYYAHNPDVGSGFALNRRDAILGLRGFDDSNDENVTVTVYVPELVPRATAASPSPGAKRKAAKT